MPFTNLKKVKERSERSNGDFKIAYRPKFQVVLLLRFWIRAESTSKHDITVMQMHLIEFFFWENKIYSITSLYLVTVAFTLHSSRVFLCQIPLLSWVTLHIHVGCLSQSRMVDSSLNVAITSFQLSHDKLKQL